MARGWTGGISRIGFLSPGQLAPVNPVFDELRRHGFVEGRNLTIDRRDRNAGYQQLAAAALELVRTSPDAIVTAGPEATRAAQAATTSVPIVAITNDMVGEGLARSLAQPGGNTTGISLLATDMGVEWPCSHIPRGCCSSSGGTSLDATIGGPILACDARL